MRLHQKFFEEVNEGYGGAVFCGATDVVYG